MIIADTSVWIDYVKGIDAPHTDMLDNELIRNRVVTGDIIITEFLQGFKNDILWQSKLWIDRDTEIF